MAWKKPDFLKSRREKNEDAYIGLAGAVIGLAIAVNDRQRRNRQDDLEAENKRLKNELLKKEIENK